MDIYNKIQAIQNFADRRKALKDLTPLDKISYQKYQTNLRQKKFMTNPLNKDRVYAQKSQYKKEYRKNNPDKVRQVVRGYVQRFRERLKIKNDTNLIVNDIIHDIINDTFNIVDTKNKATRRPNK